MSASAAAVTRLSGVSAWKAGLIGGVVAAAVNVLWYGLAKAIGVSFLAYIGPGGEPAVIPAGMVIFASIAGAAAATIVRLALARLHARGITLFRVIGVLFLLASFAGPFSAAADGATQAALILMHIIAGAAIIGSLSRGASQ